MGVHGRGHGRDGVHRGRVQLERPGHRVPAVPRGSSRGELLVRRRLAAVAGPHARARGGGGDVLSRSADQKRGKERRKQKGGGGEREKEEGGFRRCGWCAHAAARTPFSPLILHPSGRIRPPFWTARGRVGLSP